MEKPSRNDPCPCGSGKKFKKCCEGRSWKDNVKVVSSKGPSLFHKIIVSPKSSEEKSEEE